MTRLLGLFQEGRLSWPDTTNEEIEDRSKASWLVKAFALIQIVSFIAQLAGRWAQGLAATTLELFTLGIVICAAVTYTAYWEKPFDVQLPVVLKCDIIVAEEHFIDRAEFSSVENDVYHGLLGNLLRAMIALAFGAVHIVAWNFHFPSLTERLLWRISSIGVIVGPVLLVSVMVMNLLVFENCLTNRLFTLWFVALAIPYSLFRLYMFIEMFISLRASPASVYQTPQWSQYFPSFA